MHAKYGASSCPAQCGGAQGGPGRCPAARLQLQGRASCVQGRCQTKSVVYRATVTVTGSGQVKTYTGVTGNKFKQRFNAHNSDFRNQAYRSSTCLSNHIWNMKDNMQQFEIKWSIIDKAQSFNPTTRKCRVCLKEKKHILIDQAGATLNKRNKIFNTCRHRTQKLLSNVKS